MPSADFKKTLNAIEGDERPLFLLQIDHDDLTQPIRVVNDTEDVVSNGNTYLAFPYTINLPSQEEESPPTVTLEIDNVGRDLMTWLESSNGGEGATATISMVLRSNPDVVEIGPLTLDLVNVKATPFKVQGNLGYEDLLNRPGNPIEYRPHNYPGIFA